jgi:hypothetical protein
VETDQPYGSIDWYVDGVYQTTNSGNGISKSATFDYTFNTGSTTGSSYEMRARAYPASGTHDEDSYNVTVWSDLEDVSTPSASVSNRFEPGGSYAVSFSLTTPNSNYVITGAKVLVEGSQVAYQSFSDVTSATISASGILSTSVSAHATVSLSIDWTRLGGPAGYVAKWIYYAVVRSTLHGKCKCDAEDNALDNGQFTYAGNIYSNSTLIRWYTDSASNQSGEDRPSASGVYMFVRKIPVGNDIHISVASTDYHRHGTGSPPPVKQCVYSHTEYIGEIGNSAGLKFWKTTTATREKNFFLIPDEVENP